ncbi:hypothetical protein PAL_GLEAN10009785 [Pteropus alecto]|uniref:Uncharacterized protein n=1 Tax=Pteropus alecto TaxID=9402 RepID=L5KBM5_PTEAL|nr:hypothetical protein PAL_GLEAN10009785 [Pteropus alecto]
MLQEFPQRTERGGAVSERASQGTLGLGLAHQWKFTKPLGSEATGFGSKGQGELTLCCGPFHKGQPRPLPCVRSCIPDPAAELDQT